MNIDRTVQDKIESGVLLYQKVHAQLVQSLARSEGGSVALAAWIENVTNPPPGGRKRTCHPELEALRDRQNGRKEWGNGAAETLLSLQLKWEDHLHFHKVAEAFR